MIDSPDNLRGYFGIGVERMSKPMNLGALLRTAHAFGASFFFSLGSDLKMAATRPSDTSRAALSLPTYSFTHIDQLTLPRHCQLVGVELTDDATVLPSFYHPPAAAYVLGPEWGSLSPEVLAACRHVVRIPTRFCVNVAVAGALVMYDRMLTMGRFPERATSGRQQTTAQDGHGHGNRLPDGPKGHRRAGSRSDDLP